MVKKSMKKLFVGLAVLSAASTCQADVSLSKGFFQPRAASANLSRELLMEGLHKRNSDGWYGEFAATGFYQRSWSQNTLDSDSDSNANGLGALSLWSGTNVMSVGVNDGASSLDAYQFGLGNVSELGSISLDPIVYQAGADFMFIVGSSENEPGFYAAIKSAVGVYNINPQLEEVAATAVEYAEGALAISADTVANPATTMTQAFAGNTSGGQSQNGDFRAMQYGLLAGQQSTGAKFGDIEMTMGYRFISNEHNSASVAVRAAAPTGGSAEGVYMLEPIFGRGGNWLLGGYADGHMRLWEGNDSSFTARFMANAQHLFAAETMRSYDLTANGNGSRYLLVANYADGAYNSQIDNLINHTTLASDSSFGVEGEVAVTFTYAVKNWTIDLGYDFWGRSAETLEITGTLANNYAILGRQGVGLSTAGETASTLCQPNATIASAAARVDAAAGDVVDATDAANRISGVDALNIEAAQQAASLTSKIFSKVAYEWSDSDYAPHLGVMGEFDISNSNNNALPSWSVALVGGIAF
jgi:hypothetical protein